MGIDRTFKDMNTSMKMALGGAASMFAGVEIMKGLHNLEEAGEKIVHVKTMFEAALPVQSRMADMAKITGAAWAEAGKNMRTTATDNIAALHDLYNITQDISHSIELLPGFNLMKNVLDSSKEKGFGSGSSDAAIARSVQALDLAGRTTMKVLEPAVAALSATTIALGRRFNPEKYLTGIGSTGDARFGWNDEMLAKVFPAMQALGLGSRAGSAMYQLNSNLFGGGGGALGSKIQADAQVRWELHTLDDELFEGKKFKGFKVGSVFESDKLRENPLEWANDYRAKLKGMGVDIEDMKQMALIAGEIGRGNKLLKAAFDELLLPTTNAQLNREIKNINSVGKDAISNINENDPRALHQAIQAQWENVKTAIGENFVQPLMDTVIKPLTEVFKNIAQWVQANPETVKAIGAALVAIGAAMVSIGAVFVGVGIAAAIGLMGPFATGVAAVAAAIAAAGPVYLVYGDKLKELFSENGPIATAFKQIDQMIIAGVGQIPGAVSGVIDATFKAISNMISNALSSIKQYLPSWLGGGTAPAPKSDTQPPIEKHSSLVPPPRHLAVNIPVTVQMDGRRMAQTTMSHVVAAATFPTSASGMDTRGSWAGPSYSPTEQG
ncbi:phage tail tape measure protein [Methylocapsa polymorpha]|uniref:Phage tail tape measure protein n=1 Tax=Methylocapsa polymorpha TaxID=3080828 RepID=A0ABZ0HSW5_9HYPH|nr:phage tail tape measure protein [Methylocapsa sp. RX1]